MAILLDNSGIHESDEITAYCDKMDIQLIYNVTYRPDFNGIEAVWGWIKKRFRARVDWNKANEQTWDELPLVDEMMRAIPPDVAARLSRVGFEKIREGKPVFSKRFTEGPQHQLRLVDLSKILRPSAQVEQQYEEHERERERVDALVVA